VAQARAVAERLRGESGAGGRSAQASRRDIEALVRAAYRLVFARAPSAEEVALASAYLGGPESGDAGADRRWRSYVQALLASNELLYVD
jgi:hypothetical protein